MQAKTIHNKTKYVVVIGGSNIDICATSQNDLGEKTSNPGKITTSLGGVGRNIAENLALLGIDCRLISAVGLDIYGDRIIAQGKEVGINMDHVSKLKHSSTSTYVSILDQGGDMSIAISDMSIAEQINIDNHKTLIERAEIVIADTNIGEPILTKLIGLMGNQPLIVDAVSDIKAPRVIPHLNSIHTLKVNNSEAISICGENMTLKNMAKILHKKGVKNIFITLGEKGVFYSDGIHQDIIETEPYKVINSNGAGDAFSAAVGFSYLQGWDIFKTAFFAQNAARIALSHENTINPQMSIRAINNLEEN